MLKYLLSRENRKKDNIMKVAVNKIYCSNCRRLVKGQEQVLNNNPHITEPEYVDRFIRERKVDRVAVGRALFSNPDFSRQVAQKLGL